MGYTVGVVERWLPGVNIRYDYLGIIDMIALKPGEILGIQSCGEAKADHLKKLRAEKALAMIETWLAAGGRFVVWAWKRRRKNHRVVKVELVETVIDRAWVAQAKLDARLAAMTPEAAGHLADLYAAGAKPLDPFKPLADEKPDTGIDAIGFWVEKDKTH